MESKRYVDKAARIGTFESEKKRSVRRGKAEINSLYDDLSI